MVDVALLGFGRVGQALARRVQGTGARVRFVSVSDRTATVADADGLDLGRLLEAKVRTGSVAAYGAGAGELDSVEVAANAAAECLVQLTPTDLASPQRSLAEIEAGLTSGKDVVTAAKGALALAPERIGDLVSTTRRRVLSSAAVAGSVPVLELLAGAFRGDRLLHAEAVLNGSTTFILTRLESGNSFETALSLAAAAGILEEDPSLDLLGLDAAAKAAILHQRAFGSQLKVDEVEVKGITGITARECQQARRARLAVRLLARLDEAGARVAPVHLPADSPLAVTGPRSAIRLVFEGAGEVFLTGPGAGARETASAVLSDILSLDLSQKRLTGALPRPLALASLR